MKQIADALVKVQTELKPVHKESLNEAFKRPGNTGSKYADLTTVWEATRGLLTKHGLCLVQTTDFDEHGAWLRTMLLHTSGESIEGRFPLRPTKPDMQGMGSALTYARRYGLCAIVGIVADDDDDGNAASAPVPAKVTPEGVRQLPASDRKSRANAWGNAALEALPTMDGATFGAWRNKYASAVAEVRDFNESLHKRLTDAILKRSLELSVKEAAE